MARSCEPTSTPGSQRSSTARVWKVWRTPSEDVPVNRTLAAIAVCIASGLPIASQAAPVPSVPLAAQRDAEFERIWSSANWYRPHAVKLWCRVHADPKAGYAFLNRKIAPIQLSVKEAKRAIDDLGSDDEKVWKAAEARLRNRDVRLAMNFLDAWDYTKSEAQRQRLASVVYLEMEFPQYYDAKLVKNPPAPGLPPTYSLKMQLNPNVSKDLQLQFGLGLGESTDLDGKQLAVPDSGQYNAEASLIRYLANVRSVESNGLIDRLAEGHPGVEATKLALASFKSRSKSCRRDLGARLSPDTLPSLWEDWGYPQLPDSLTQKMLVDSDTTLAFLRPRMKPIRASALQCGLLLSLLPHPSDDVWDRACHRLLRADPRFCLPVEAIWKLAKTPDQQRRVARLFGADPEVAKYMDYNLIREGIGNRGYWMLESHVRKDIAAETIPPRLKGEGYLGVSEDRDDLTSVLWSREEAAIWILEAIGTDAALAMVREMATGHPDARPTIAAKDVLARRPK